MVRDCWLPLVGFTLAPPDYLNFFFVQEVTSHMGVPDDSVKHFSMTHDIKDLLVFVDIVLYGSLRQEPGFPPLLLRSMSSEIPIIVPNLTVITKYVCYFIFRNTFFVLPVLRDAFINVFVFSGH